MGLVRTRQTSRVAPVGLRVPRDTRQPLLGRRHTFEREQMMTTVPMITLNDGVEIPQLGFGTMDLADARDDSPESHEVTAVGVAAAVAAGYRHFDTAQMYVNERGVGLGLARSGLPREEFFLTSISLTPRGDHPNRRARHRRPRWRRPRNTHGRDMPDRHRRPVTATRARPSWLEPGAIATEVNRWRGWS